MSKDFVVGNIHCPKCHNNMWFSNSQSTPYVAIFYCENVACKNFGFFLRYDETEWHHIMVERIED